MKVTVLYFAAARERAGLAREELELEPGTVADVLAEACRTHQGLAALLPHLRVAVNQQFARLEDVIPGGAELALIPPVAGG